jgi:acetoin utilization protein AcuB
MLVGARMTYPVITIGPRATLDAAKELIVKEDVHSLPVVDRQGRLMGLITRDMLEEALQNPQPTENPEPLVEDIMTQQVLTVTENTPIEEAARIITDYDVNSLPVVRGNFVVGIISAISLIRILLELTGARKQGIRITIMISDVPGKLLPVLQKIADMNASISTISTYCSEEKGYRVLTLKIADADKYQLKQELTPLVHKIIDIR